MLVEVHAGFRGDVLGADDLTVSLKSLQLKELGRREELQGERTTTETEDRQTLARGTSAGVSRTSMTSVLRMCRDSVPPQYKYCMTSWKRQHGFVFKCGNDSCLRGAWVSKRRTYVENVVLDVADLDAGVLCSRAVLQQRLKPAWDSNVLWVCWY